MTTKMDDAEAYEAMNVANKAGVGLVKVSSKRYIVIMPLGAQADRSSSTHMTWIGHIGYRALTRPLERVRAMEVVVTLMLARQRGTHAALEIAVEDLDPALRPEWEK